ncbi:MAG: transcriptional regulator PpsR [Geminicoccaceae bacterium]
MAKIVATATDIALIIDDKGVVRDMASGDEELAATWLVTWLGRPWVDTVTVESRPKVQAMLTDAADERRRHVNHALPHHPDLPVLYTAVRLGDTGNVLALGRDLRAMAALQQRVVTAQQSMERDYSRLRHVETRYRLLFQVTSEAVLVVDASSHKIVEANPAAGQLLGETTKRIVGHSFFDGFDPATLVDIRTLLAGVQASGRAENVRARLAEGQRELLIFASLFRQESASLFLIRLLPLGGDAGNVTVAKSRLLELVESAPDGFVVTGLDGRILTANAAFLDLTQLATEEQARGESLERWLGRPGVDLNVLIANLRQHGTVRLFATTLRGEYGAAAEIEVSAVAVAAGDQPCYGFTIRNVGRRLPPESRLGTELPRSVEQLTELVGRVPLKDLVRETTDVIERLCIEAALELTGDNRASAAEILGLSRQSLYVKLRRYGLGDLGSDGPDEG